MYNKSGEVRVIDYALARRVSGGLMKMFEGRIPRQGTKTYMSPEQIRCDSPDADGGYLQSRNHLL